MYKLIYILLLFFCCVGCGSPHGSYLSQLRSGSVEERIDAASFLGAQRVVEAVPHLQAALADTSSRVRTKVAWALGMLRAKEALPNLIKLLSDSDRDVRQSISWALMQLEEPEAIPVLKKAIEVEADAWVKKDMERTVRYLTQFEGEADIEESSVRGEFF